EVDRLGVEAQQCVELTNTNRSRAYPKETTVLSTLCFAASFQGARGWFKLHAFSKAGYFLAA
ncbi:hypothetical protein, partial [Paenibacillus larvae]|uniref:hypothetical protein n=1 Tax=Paenibacillus larvae TaxID=1464 RepID=UPI003F6A7FF1